MAPLLVARPAPSAVDLAARALFYVGLLVLLLCLPELLMHARRVIRRELRWRRIERDTRKDRGR